MRRTFAGLVPFISILAIFCACSGGAAARTSLADPARTSVTLEVWPEQGLFGFVGSTHKCGTARKVVVSRKIGDDWRRIGIARSLHRPSARPGTYQWRLETKKTTGRLRVKVASSARCRGAARARSLLPTSGDHPPDCPASDWVDRHWVTRACRLNELHLNLNIGPCPAFSKPVGECEGHVNDGDRWPWSPGYALVDWKEVPGKAPMRTFTFASDIESTGGTRSVMSGSLASSSSPAWPVWVHIGNLDERICYQSPDLGEPAGQPGGPLYLNWVNGVLGADAYIRVFLYPTGQFGCQP